MKTPLTVTAGIVHDLPTFADKAGARIRSGAMRGAQRFRARVKLEFRQDTRLALGDRAANTWRDEVYPKGGRKSWHPAVHVWSKWPVPVRAHADGATIVHKQGLLLAIPTDNVPNKGRKPASPAEVESMFNQDLIFVRSRRNPLVTFAFVEAVASRNRRGWRMPTRRRQAQGRKVRRVLMFVMVRQVTLRKRIDPDRLAEKLGPVYADYLADDIRRELAA